MPIFVAQLNVAAVESTLIVRIPENSDRKIARWQRVVSVMSTVKLEKLLYKIKREEHTTIVLSCWQKTTTIALKMLFLDSFFVIERSVFVRKLSKQYRFAYLHKMLNNAIRSCFDKF